MPSAVQESTFTLPKEDELERAISDYLNISRNKNNEKLFRPYNYWPTEERAWERFVAALALNGIHLYPEQETLTTESEE